MCLDDSLLSAYVDGEVPSPWDERMKSHLSSCAACREKAAGYARLKERMIRDETCEEALAFARAKARVSASLDFSGAPARSRGTSLLGSLARFWSREITLSMPIAAIGAILVILSAGLAIGGIRSYMKAPSPGAVLMATSSHSVIDQQTFVQTVQAAEMDSSNYVVLISSPAEIVPIAPRDAKVVMVGSPATEGATETATGGSSR